MRGPGEILLVSCYELGHQPLSLASPLAFLTRAGYRPGAVDVSVESLPDPAIERARFVGISVPMHTALRLGVQVAERVRAVNPAAHICFYGLYAVLNAKYLLDLLADSVVGGEYEHQLLSLVDALASGVDAAEVGVGTRGRPALPALRRLAFPLPERDGLPGLDRYARLEIDGELRLAGYVEASRGCLHRCRHCPIPSVYDGRFFVVPRETVLEDIRRQVRLGARHVTFGDPDFLNGPGHSLKIVRAMHAEFPHLTFDATIKIEHVLEQRSLFPELRQLGCAFVVSAVESLSDTVLRQLDKGHTRSDVVEALAILRSAGIPLRASLVPFTPWSTLDDYLDLLEFVEAHDLIDYVDPVQYSIRLLIPPGSLLLDRPDALEWLGELDQAAFTYRWAHPDSRMDQLHRDVSARVEAAGITGEDPRITFAAINDLADRSSGRPAKRMASSTRPSRSPLYLERAGALTKGATPPGRPPRLTESWFC